MTAFMKPSTVTALRKMAELTRPKCADVCPTHLPMKPTRCCDRMFCEIAQVTMRELGGGEMPPTGHAELPNMRTDGTGCQIPPEFRPVCTGYICDRILKTDPGFASRWEQLQERISADPNVRRAVERSKKALGGLEGALNRFRQEHPIATSDEPLKPGDRCLVQTTLGAKAEEATVIRDDGETVTVLFDGVECANSFPREQVMALVASREERGQ